MGESKRESSMAAEILGVAVAAAVGAYVARRSNRVVGMLAGLIVVPIVQRSTTRLATALGI
jgi:tetrahydromethanopterin S-methyltransferase subunit C